MRFPIFWALGRGMLTRHHAFEHLTAQISPGMALDWEKREAVTAASCCPAHERCGARIL